MVDGIANAISELSEDALRVEEGSLYPALHRMEEAGWIGAEWQITENKRRARIYRMAPAGAAQLALETERWVGYSEGVSRVSAACITGKGRERTSRLCRGYRD